LYNELTLKFLDYSLFNKVWSTLLAELHSHPGVSYSRVKPSCDTLKASGVSFPQVSLPGFHPRARQPLALTKIVTALRDIGFSQVPCFLALLSILTLKGFD
jgi:hypothetical protein